MASLGSKERTMTARWHVVQSEPRREFLAKMNIVDKLKLDVFFPIEEVRRSIGRRSADVVAPMFPGYLFVEFDPAVTQWRKVNELRGVMRLLCEGDRPIPVPGLEIDRLRDKANADGLIVEPEKAMAGMGEWVRIMQGAFAQFSGPLAEPLYPRDNNAYVRLHLLGREMVVRVEAEHVSASA